jgi:CYTH domain-containing protein
MIEPFFMKEIERKFLVENLDFLSEASSSYPIAQGYLNSDPNRSVRIRKTSEGGFITVKGASSQSGMSRFEWEKPLSSKEVDVLLPLCEEGTIVKDRYLVPFMGKVFEVDVFKEANKGLILAEVELEEEDEHFEKPHWLGTEVTSDPRYYNSYLSKNPFSQWS